MKIEKQIEMTGVLLTVRLIAHLSDGAQLVVWFSNHMDRVRFYGHASVRRFDAGTDYRVDKPGLEWFAIFQDDRSVRVFEAVELALREAGRLSGDAAACLASYARSAGAEARTFGALAEFNA